MKKWIALFSGALIAILLAEPLAMSAATPSGEGLEISPPVIELRADPGQTLTTSIRVRNVASGELIVKGFVDDFGAGSNEDGSPHILINEQASTRFSMKTWVQPIPGMVLAPQELKTTTVTINVPKNAEPGGHFGVVRFTAVPPGLDGTGVALSASVGSLILLRVSGTINEQLSVASFNTVKTVKTKGKPDTTKPSSFFEYGPITFDVRIKNDGSIHEKPQGSIVVKDTFGKGIATLAVNQTGGNVLPDSIRKYETTLEKKNLFGYYTAKMDLGYAASTKHLYATTHFWVIPWKAILLVILVIVVLFFGLKFLIKKYNNYVIAQARKR